MVRLSSNGFSCRNACLNENAPALPKKTYFRAKPPPAVSLCLVFSSESAGQARLAADGGVNGFLDHAIWVRCHSTPSRSFLEPPICPSFHGRRDVSRHADDGLDQ